MFGNASPVPVRVDFVALGTYGRSERRDERHPDLLGASVYARWRGRVRPAIRAAIIEGTRDAAEP